MRWDRCNKWLYIGEHFILQFDNWYWITRIPTIRQWNLFQVMYDNGAWWSELDHSEVSVPTMEDGKVARKEFDIWSGRYPCFVRVTIFGIGFQVDFRREMGAVIQRLPDRR